MANATFGSLFAHAALEVEHSPPHRGRIDRLRALARGETRNGYSGDTGRITGYSIEELKALAADGKRRHVSDYLAGCRTAARLGLLAQGRALDELASRVHELVCRDDGYLVDVSGIVPDRDWPEGPTGSSLSAVIAGASWGSGATAQRQLSRRYRSDVELPVSTPPGFEFRSGDDLKL